MFFLTSNFPLLNSLPISHLPLPISTMGKKIINLTEAGRLAEKLHKSNKTIVLVGGVFDILHPGHIKFLLEAKKQGDVLFVALEADSTVSRLKGKDRPVHNQEERAVVLVSLTMVDHVILLPELKGDKDYFAMVRGIKPNVIAVTAGDPQLENKKRQAKEVGGRVVVVTKPVRGNSTSKIIKLLEKEV